MHARHLIVASPAADSNEEKWPESGCPYRGSHCSKTGAQALALSNASQRLLLVDRLCPPPILPSRHVSPREHRYALLAARGSLASVVHGKRFLQTIMRGKNDLPVRKCVHDRGVPMSAKSSAMLAPRALRLLSARADARPVSVEVESECSSTTAAKWMDGGDVISARAAVNCSNHQIATATRTISPQVILTSP